MAENAGRSVAPFGRQARYIVFEEPARLKDVRSLDWAWASSMLLNPAADRKVENKIAVAPELDEGACSRLAALVDRHGSKSSNPSAGRSSLVRQAAKDLQAFLEIANSLHHGQVAGGVNSVSMVILGIRQAVGIAADGTFQNSTSSPSISGTGSMQAAALHKVLKNNALQLIRSTFRQL